MKFFKPEDFGKGINHTLTIGFGDDGKYIALSNALYIVNAKLEREGVRVYGNDEGEWTTSKHSAMDDEHAWATHQALLVGREELPKLECEHEPRASGWGRINPGPVVLTDTCRHCGVKLKAKWEVAGIYEHKMNCAIISGAACDCK